MKSEGYKKLKYDKNGSVWINYPDLCKSCGLCVIKCPVKALSWDMTENEYLGLPAVKNDIERCILCGTCENVCPDSTIRLIKRK